MGMEQGGYVEGDSGPEFTYGYGGGGDEFAVDYASDYGGAYNFTGDYSAIDFGAGDDFNYDYGVGTGAEYGDSGYSPGGDLYGAYVDYYTNQGFDLATAMEFAAQDAAEGSIETITSESAPLPDIFNQPFYDLPYIPDQFLTPYNPIFPDLPPPLPPIYEPIVPLTVAPPPQIPLPQVAPTGAIPKAPGLPPACPVGQYHPYPIGHPEQNKCIPFPPAQTSPAPAPKQTAPGPVPASTAPKPPAQQSKCPTGQYRDPLTQQCKPIPQGQPQQCPTGYYRASSGQCLPIPKCTTPGTVFDAAQNLCVPKAQAISPVSEWDSIFGGFKEIPWWVWAGLAGLLLLRRDDDKPRRRAR